MTLRLCVKVLRSEKLLSLRCNSFLPAHQRCISHSVVQSRGSRDHLFNFDDALHNEHFSVISSSETFSEVQKLYRLNARETWQLLRSPLIPTTKPSQILQSLEYLKHMNIDKEQLFRVPWIVVLRKDDLQRKVSLLLSGESMFVSASHCLGLCRLALPDINRCCLTFLFERASVPQNQRNKVYFIANELSLPVEQTAESLSRAPHVLWQPMPRVVAFVDLINRYNISKEDVLSDPWVFLQNYEDSVERFRAAQQVIPGELKPWLGRCTQKSFDNYLKRQERLQEDQLLLEQYGGDTLTLVSAMLDCSPKLLASYVSDRHCIHTSRASKVKDFLQLMLREGYSTLSIVKHLWLVKASLKTLERRIKILKEFDYPQDIMYHLGASNKCFDLYIKKLDELKKTRMEA